jgi:hypothetical protein
MTSVLLLLLLLSLIVNLAQLINTRTAAKHQHEADSRIVIKCMDAGTKVYRESMDAYRRGGGKDGREPKMFQRALGAMEVVAAIREKFPRATLRATAEDAGDMRRNGAAHGRVVANDAPEKQ